MQPTTFIIAVLLASIFCMAFGYGLNTSLPEAFSLFRRPWLLARSLLAMYIVMPLVAVLISVYLHPHPFIKTALVAISVSPLPPLFPRKPLKAGAMPSDTTGMLVAMSLFSILLIPVILQVLTLITGKPIHIPPLHIAKIVLVTILLPLGSGIAFRYFAPAPAVKIARPVGRIGIALLVSGVIPLLILFLPEVWQLVGNGTVLLIVLFVVAGLVTGHLLGGPHPTDRNVLAFATAARHPGVAMAVATTHLPDQKHMAAAIVLYLLVNAILTFSYLQYLQRNRFSAPA